MPIDRIRAIIRIRPLITDIHIQGSAFCLRCLTDTNTLDCESTDRQTDRRTDGRMDGHTDGRTLPSALSPSLRGR